MAEGGSTRLDILEEDLPDAGAARRYRWYFGFMMFVCFCMLCFSFMF